MTVPGSPSASNGAFPKAAETPHTAMKVQGMSACADSGGTAADA